MRGAVALGGLQLEHNLPSGVSLHPFVGQRRVGGLAAQLLKRSALVGAVAHSGAQVNPLMLAHRSCLKPSSRGIALCTVHFRRAQANRGRFESLVRPHDDQP